MKKPTTLRLIKQWSLASAIAVSMTLALSGCEMAGGEDDEEIEDLTIVVEADKSRITQEEKALTAKRKAAAIARDRITNTRADVVTKNGREVQAAGRARIDAGPSPASSSAVDGDGRAGPSSKLESTEVGRCSRDAGEISIWCNSLPVGNCLG